MKLVNRKFHSYVLNQRFGNYYLPARYQYILLRDYYSKINQNFILPQGEPVFSNTKIRLRTIINNLKKNDGLVFLSAYMLPENKKLRQQIINSLIKKNIEVHFIFENFKCKNKKDYHKVEDLFKLNKFSNAN